MKQKLAKYRKAVVAAVVALFAIGAFFIQFDPGLQVATVAVIVGGFNVAGVILAKNHTADDLSKAVVALQASAVGLAGYFLVVDPGTLATVTAIITAGLNVYGVFRVSNTASPPLR